MSLTSVYLIVQGEGPSRGSDVHKLAIDLTCDVARTETDCKRRSVSQRSNTYAFCSQTHIEQPRSLNALDHYLHDVERVSNHGSDKRGNG